VATVQGDPTATGILDRIVSARRASVERFKASGNADALRAEAAQAPPPRDFQAALHGRGVAIIAECKQRSPSAGVLQDPYDPVGLATQYVEAGASAISVLTEPEFFGGRPRDLRAVRAAVPVPVLCKDFIVDELQVTGARAMGADAILLITALLDDGALRRLYQSSTAHGMQALVEVHSERDVRRAIDLGATLVGINNRDLTSMRVDLETTARLRPLIPQGRTVISESGLRGRADIDRLAGLHVDAALVGESLLRGTDPSARLKALTERR
jgi:indole-3-glycerol phosphate synthase